MFIMNMTIHIEYFGQGYLVMLFYLEISFLYGSLNYVVTRLSGYVVLFGDLN